MMYCINLVKMDAIQFLRDNNTMWSQCLNACFISFFTVFALFTLFRDAFEDDYIVAAYIIRQS